MQREDVSADVRVPAVKGEQVDGAVDDATRVDTHRARRLGTQGASSGQPGFSRRGGGERYLGIKKLAMCVRA